MNLYLDGKLGEGDHISITVVDPDASQKKMYEILRTVNP